MTTTLAFLALYLTGTVVMYGLITIIDRRVVLPLFPDEDPLSGGATWLIAVLWPITGLILAGVIVAAVIADLLDRRDT
jgi:hypothetical protein